MYSGTFFLELGARGKTADTLSGLLTTSDIPLDSASPTRMFISVFDGTAQRKINVEHTLVWQTNQAVWVVGDLGTRIGLPHRPLEPQSCPSHFDCENYSSFKPRRKVFSDRPKSTSLRNCRCPNRDRKRQLFYQFSARPPFHTAKTRR